MLSNTFKSTASLLFALLSFVVLVCLYDVPTGSLKTSSSSHAAPIEKGYPPGHPRRLQSEYTPPKVRFTPWVGLTTRQRNIAMYVFLGAVVEDLIQNKEENWIVSSVLVAHYVSSLHLLDPRNLLEYTGAVSWNNLMTNSMEKIRLENVFEYLNSTIPDTSIDELEEFFETEMGFTHSNWDCWVNHYTGFTWRYFSLYKFNWTLIDLGWTEKTWNSKNESLAPPSESKSWKQLSNKERAAAEELCYNADIWDDIPIDEWVASTALADAPTESPAPTEAPTGSPTDPDF
jgi:hypothetical protein